MAALHAPHRAGQWLRVLARDRTGRCTAIIAPLTLMLAVLKIPLLAALGCANRRKGHDSKSNRQPQEWVQREVAIILGN